MNRKSGLAGGIILILLGLLFLANEIFPETFNFWDWPILLLGLGLAFILWAILGGLGGLAVPGAILSGLGAIFYLQNRYDAWDTWAYAWAVIPGLVGLGVILSGIIDRDFKNRFFSGLTLIIISAILFFAFGSFLGLDPNITRFWPALLVLLGVVSLIRALVRNKN